MPVLPPLHGLTEHLRERVCSAPSDVLREVEDLLQSKPGRADRLRLLGLSLACCRNLEDERRGRKLMEQADELGAVRHPVARADWALQVGSFLTFAKDRAGAEDSIRRGLEIVENELQGPTPSSKGARQRRAWFEAWGAVLRVVRGETALRLAGDAGQAFRDALEVLRTLRQLDGQTSPSRGGTGCNRRRAHLAAVTLLSVTLADHGSVSVLPEVLELLRQAEKVLIYKLKRSADDMHRIRIRWCRALVLARLGSTRQAEGLLVDVLERLTRQGHSSTAKHALDGLCWVIERAGHTGRAQLVREKWSPNLS